MALIGVLSKDIRTNRRGDKTVEGIRLLVLQLTERCNLRCAAWKRAIDMWKFGPLKAACHK